MNKIKTSSLLLFSTLIFSLSSCSYKQVEFMGVDNVKIDQMNKQGVKATIFARVNNPNRYKIRVKSNNLQLRAAGTNLGTATISNKVVLKKNVTDTYPIEVTLGYKDLAKGALKSIPGILLKQSVYTEIKGDLKGRVFLFSKKFPINLNKRIKLMGGK